MSDNSGGRRKRIVCLACLIIALAGIFFYFHWEDHKDIASVEKNLDENSIRFSADSGWYTDDLSIELTISGNLPQNCQIRYTTNGNDPTISDRVYDQPIRLKPSDRIKVVPIKAAVFNGEDRGTVTEHTYILCKKTFRNYDLPVICITTDRANLYDYDTGIFARGRIYDQSSSAKEDYIVGNYNQRSSDWIRDAHVLLFDENREIQWDQRIGLGVSGWTSSAYDIKSLKMTASGRNADKLHFSFFRNQETSTVPNITQYVSLRPRSGSQDLYNGANLKSAVVSRIAEEIGFDGCTDSQRCIVFLNGEYQGIYDLQQNYSDSFLAHRYGLKDPDQIEKRKGSIITENYNEYWTRLCSIDYAIPGNRSELEEYIDIDDYLLYYAFEILINNTDWPDNSFEKWSYQGAEEPTNPYTDGRIRFLVYDVDLIYATEKFGRFLNGACLGDTLNYLLSQKVNGVDPLFFNIIQTKYYRDRLVTILTTLLNTACKPSELTKIIDEEHDRIAPAVLDLNDTAFNSQFETQTEEMRTAVQRRPAQIRRILEDAFDLSSTYKLEIHASEGINVKLENMVFSDNESYSGDHYREITIDITQETAPGYAFSGWLVNGKKVYEDKLSFSAEYLADCDELCIEPIAMKNVQNCLILSEISPKGDQDWVKIMNAGTLPVNLRDYYLSDDRDNLFKYHLPNIEVQPGESITVYGRKSTYSYGGYVCNFSMKSYESICLSCTDRICDSVFIPYIEEGQEYRRDISTGEWYFSFDCEGTNYVGQNHIVTYVNENRSHITITYPDPDNQYDWTYFKINMPVTGSTKWALGMYENGYWVHEMDISDAWPGGYFEIEVFDRQSSLLASIRKYIHPVKHDLLTAVVLPNSKKIEITLKTDKEYTFVTFPTWGERYDQSDLIWYEAEQTEPGCWKAYADLKKHGEEGVYNIHAYAFLSDEECIVLETATYY